MMRTRNQKCLWNIDRMMENLTARSKVFLNSKIDKALSRTSYILVKRPVTQHKVVMDYFAQWATGVLHLGGHLGSEAKEYAAFGQRVIWVEAMPDVAERLTENISQYPDQVAIQACITDQDDQTVNFKVSNVYDGLSSSIFDFGPASAGKDSLWPADNLHTIRELSLTTTTIDTLFARLGREPRDFNHWVVDLQGAELLALQGGQESLKSCRSLLVETSTVDVYKGGARWSDVRDFLVERGFVPAWEASGHMDVLFLRTQAAESD